MRKIIGVAVLAGGLFTVTSPVGAFQCPQDIAEAEAAIASASEAMNAMSDKNQMGLVHTLIDDAKMMLMSAKHNHEKPAAGKLDHARSVAKARAAKGYAEAAAMMVKQ